MEPIKLSLSEQDRTTYGGPEWLDYDIPKLNGLPFDQLDPWDEELLSAWGVCLNEFTAYYFPATNRLRGIVGAVWLAGKLSGHDFGPLTDFKIQPRGVRMIWPKADDAVPPTATSSDTSSEEAPSATASKSSSRGSGARTKSRPT